MVENVRVGRRVFQRQALYLGERRVVLLCPARALAVGFAVASSDLPSGLRPSAHAPARPKSIRALGVGFTASELLAARNSSNETLRRRFICIATHLFVRQDSRTSVALCTAYPPNRMSISLRFSSFQLIVHAELCLAYLCQQALHPPGLRSLRRGGAPRDGGCDGARQQRLRPHGAEPRETRGGLTRAEKRCYNLREICGD